MNSMFRLKSPMHVSFGRDGHTREEVIRYVYVDIPSHWADRVELTDEGMDEKRKFAARVDNNPCDSVEELALYLAGADINEAVREAYVRARRAAFDFLWAKAQQDDPDAKPYRGPDGVYATDPAIVADLLAHRGEPIPDRTPTKVSVEDHCRMIDGEFFK